MKKNIGGLSTGEMVGIGVGVLAVGYFFMKSQPVVPATIIRTPIPTNTSAATTAAEVAAGTTILSSILDDFNS